MRWIVLLVLVGTVAADSSHGPASGEQIAPGDAWSMSFEAPGTVEYYCAPHPWMVGTIRVEPQAGAPTEHRVDITEAGAWGFAPEGLVVRAGDTVTWNNTGAVMHQVTWTHIPEDRPVAAWTWIAAATLAGVALAAFVNRRLA